MQIHGNIHSMFIYKFRDFNVKCKMILIELILAFMFSEEPPRSFYYFSLNIKEKRFLHWETSELSFQDVDFFIE